MKDKKIDLGREIEPMDSPVKEDTKGKKYYPSLYISDVEGLENLPEEGEAVIHFKRVRASVQETDEGTQHSADLEVHSIEFKPSEDYEEDEDGEWLDKAAKKLGIKHDKHEAEETPEEEAAEHEEG